MLIRKPDDRLVNKSSATPTISWILGLFYMFSNEKWDFWSRHLSSQRTNVMSDITSAPVRMLESRRPGKHLHINQLRLAQELIGYFLQKAHQRQSNHLAITVQVIMFVFSTGTSESRTSPWSQEARWEPGVRVDECLQTDELKLIRGVLKCKIQFLTCVCVISNEQKTH